LQVGKGLVRFCAKVVRHELGSVERPELHPNSAPIGPDRREADRESVGDGVIGSDLGQQGE
jgi:hypothetical protein